MELTSQPVIRAYDFKFSGSLDPEHRLDLLVG